MLYVVFGLLVKLYVKIVLMNFDVVCVMLGVVVVFMVDDILGVNDCGLIIYDDLVFVKGVVQFVGQLMFIVVVMLYDIVWFVVCCVQVDYEELLVILIVQEVCVVEIYVILLLKFVCGDVVVWFVVVLYCELGEMLFGGQEQFYLEGQIVYVVLKDDDGMYVYCLMQYLSEMQYFVVYVFGVVLYNVLVECCWMGGGFGGKELQLGLFVCCVVFVVWKLLCLVKLCLDCDDDMMIIGKWYDFYYCFDVGYDDDGCIDGVVFDMMLCCGFLVDLFGLVMMCVVCYFDNVYWFGDVDIVGYCGRINMQLNIVFCGFGGLQGVFVIEYIFDDIVCLFGCDLFDVCYVNLYGKIECNVMLYGQMVEDNVLQELFGEFEMMSDYCVWCVGVCVFNVCNMVLKKGIVFMLVKFGIVFNVMYFNQVGVLVYIYIDGLVFVNYGGMEMGQGFNMKVVQVVVYEFGICFGWICVMVIDISKVVNMFVIVVLIGLDLNGKVVQDVVCQLCEWFVVFVVKQFGDGKVDVVDVKFGNDVVWVGGYGVLFGEVIVKVYFVCVQLWFDGFYVMLKLYWDQLKLQGWLFYYYLYGVVVLEVVIDMLMGEMCMLCVDVLYDVGVLLNLVFDIGQVEGVFIQGMGWFMIEELWWNQGGKLMMYVLLMYKILMVNDMLFEFNVWLFQNCNVEDSIYCLKVVGELLLLLLFLVFFVVCDVVVVVGDYWVNLLFDVLVIGELILCVIGVVWVVSVVWVG